MNRAQHQVAGAGRPHGYGHALLVPHLTDDDDIRRLPENMAQSLAERLGIPAHFALVDIAHFMFVQIFNRVLKGQDIAAAVVIDNVHQGAHGR